VSKITQHLYVTDGKQRRIWEFDCKNDCGEPMVFLDSEALQAPSTLAVGLDGTVWLGDLSEQSLTAISSDGTVRTTIRALGGSR
jgi:sugar lactone lactonase YvrE